MISGANLKHGLAVSPDGAPYVYGIASTSAPPAGSQNVNGGGKKPPRKVVTSDGAIVVRYI